MWAMTSEVIAANRSYIPEVWYNALSVEEKYDAFNHPDCPLKISRLPAPEWPQWVKDWSESSPPPSIPSSGLFARLFRAET